MTRVRLIRELEEFLIFSTGLWGMFAALSVLFPLVNAITGTIPLQAGAASLGTVLAMIACMFAFAYTFTEKSHIERSEMHRPFFRGEVLDPRRDLMHSSVSRFAWGLISLAAYVLLNAAPVLIQSADGEAAKWIALVAEPVATVFYAVAFALVTGAFGALAVMQYTAVPVLETKSRAGQVDLGVSREDGLVVEGSKLTSASDGIDESHAQS